MQKINVFHKESVEKDLRKIDKKYRLKILVKIEKELSAGARGKKLKGKLQDLYSYQVGDYRVLYALSPGGILITRIRHRKEVYH